MNTFHRLLATLILLCGGLALVGTALQDEAVKEELPPPHVPAPAPDGRPAMLDGWESMECVECHREIASEWASTLHAQAWIDQRYQDAIAEKRRPQSCYGCHIPQPLQLSPFGGKPRPRNPETTPSDEALHYGISCLSCHLGPDDTMLGPYESDPDNEISPAHKSMKGEAFGGTLGDALCINCHRTNVGPVIGIAKDFEVTRQADKGLSCVGCHMSQVERSAAIETLEDGTTKHSPVRLGRSHALQTPRDPKFLAEAFGLDARLTDTGAELLITNQAAHRIPGLKTRSMTFVVQALDVDGKVLGEASLLIDSRAYLPVDGLLPIDITSATAPAKLQVTATHDWIGVEAPVEFVNKALELK